MAVEFGHTGATSQGATTTAGRLPAFSVIIPTKDRPEDLTIAVAGQSGNFELNVMLPLATRSLLQSIRYLGNATRNFADNLVAGLKATSRGPDTVESGLMLVTALAPAIGYDAAAALAKEAYQKGRTIRDLARERTSLSEGDLDRILDPAAMVEPGRTFASTG